MKLHFVALLAIAFPLSSLAATEGRDRGSSAARAVQPQVVFLRPKGGSAGGGRTRVFERGPGGSKELGGFKGESKLVVNVSPGEHRFMANTLSKVHFLDAKLEAGKRYYVLARFIYGNGFQLRPVRRDGSDYSAATPDFAQWLQETPTIAPAAVDTAWVEHFTPLTDEAIAHAQKGWDLKNEWQRSELTLRPEDSLP